MQIAADDDQLISSAAVRSEIRALTLNNLACLHEHGGSLDQAADSLYDALEEESQSTKGDPAGTHLNLCAVLSQLGEALRCVADEFRMGWVCAGKHQEALQHAQMGLQGLLKHPEQSRSSMIPIAYQVIAAVSE